MEYRKYLQKFNLNTILILSNHVMEGNLPQSGNPTELRRLSQLSILLAGPILRRVDTNQVCIWIACSRPVTLRAKVFRVADICNTESTKDTLDGKDSNIIGDGTTESIKLGEHLHIGLVIARPIVTGMDSEAFQGTKSPFPTDELLAYDLEIAYDLDDLRRKESKCLKELGLLDGKNTIVYGNHKQSGRTKEILLPTFFIRGKSSSPLNLLYGSCRKLHGKGEDCLMIADDMIRNSLTDLAKRPSALFLVGDQIYADDVADDLINYLTRFGMKLAGYEEPINGLDIKLTDIPVGGRQQVVRKHAKFTSENAGNHLLSFGEFAAMYLIAWNGENWPEFCHVNIGEFNVQKDQKKIQMETEQLERAHEAMPKIRRILANVPTYMICDDHEITDDWNITKEWVENVKDSSCGMQVVTNGLAAYWAFQAWGNNPNLFDQNFVDVVSGYLCKSGNVTINEKNVFQNYLWNFHGWTFDAPTIPLTLFLDCRTQRQFDSFQGPPRLINDEGLQSILNLTQRIGHRRSEPLLLVSPTPVFGFDLAEELQQYLASKSNIYKWDLETWSANERGYVRLLSFLGRDLGARHYICLSGDVHYGFTISATFTPLDKVDRFEKNGEKKDYEHQTTNIIQLNSSALKTTSLGKEFLLNEVIGDFRQLFVPTQTVRVGWNDMSFKAKKLRKGDKDFLSFINHIEKGSWSTGESKVVKGEATPFIPPDWIESRSIHKRCFKNKLCVSRRAGLIHRLGSLFKPCLPKVVIAENNIGLVSISGGLDKILSHTLHVHKKSKETTEVWETIAELGGYQD